MTDMTEQPELAEAAIDSVALHRGADESAVLLLEMGGLTFRLPADAPGFTETVAQLRGFPAFDAAAFDRAMAEGSTATVPLWRR